MISHGMTLHILAFGWHYCTMQTSKVFESSLNNLKLFFSMPADSNRIIQSFICGANRLFWLAQGQLESCCGEEKKSSLHDLFSISIILKVKERLTLYLLFISWVFDHYNLSYSTLKSFAFGRFFLNFQGVSYSQKFSGKHSFPNLAIVELPNLCFPNT